MNINYVFSFGFVFHDTVHFVSKLNCSHHGGCPAAVDAGGTAIVNPKLVIFFLIVFGRRTVQPAVAIAMTVIRVPLRLD